MSWQTYVDTHLVGTGMVTAACIIGHDGAVWASKDLDVKEGEGVKLAQAFIDPSGILAQGLHISGVKYMTIRADARSIYGKKGATGVVTVKTKSTIVIGFYGDSVQPGQCTLAVERLGDYLIENGY
eukprot:TRINITY_DN328_c1_g1_i1.p2 TRINITY_DN328_c1_g1~~TRINITY_DN328_c1_g1_i1.p2  ORF type:complete len:126 (+),score=36.62 TRINITY_DN328_c1_g1_i1:250-627(+)